MLDSHNQNQLFILRESKEDYKTKFESKISDALSRPKKCENGKLRVAPIAQPNVQEWLKRSLSCEGLIRKSRRERHRIKSEVTGACSPNSVFQALVCQYIDNKAFRKAIDEHIQTSRDADLARSIALFAQQGATEHFYRLRTELLSKICLTILKDDMKYIRCGSFTSDSLTDFVTPLSPTIVITSNCECRIEVKFVSLPIDEAHFREHGLPELQQAIDKRIDKEKVLCKRCGRKCTQNHVLGGFVLVNVGRPKCKMQLVKNLEGIPLKIRVNKHQYDLSCFIDVRKRGHSMVNCLRSNGDWYQYNDAQKKPELLGNESMPQFLMYTRKVE